MQHWIRQDFNSFTKITHTTLINRCKKILGTGLCPQEVRHNTFFRHCSCWSNTNSLLCRIWEAEKLLAFWLEEARQPYFHPLQNSHSQNQHLYPPRKYILWLQGTMLQKLSKCEVMAAWWGNLTILQPTQILREIKFVWIKIV